jgi:hypothetical protein
MAKWKILHLVGGNISLGVAEQLRGQCNVLPAEVFEQRIAAGESRTAKFLETLLLRPMYRLGRQLGLNLTAAGMLRKTIRKYNPDMVVCWDVSATEQLQAAILGSRRRLAVVAMLFQEDRAQQLQLKSNYHNIGLHLVCGSERVVRWAKEELAASQRIHQIYPVLERAEGRADRRALREAMGLPADSIPVFMPTEGKIEDMYQGLIACGIVERVEHRLRVVVSGYDAERAERCYHFVNRTVGVPMLHIIEDWDIRSTIEVCEMAMQVMSDYADTLLLVEAMGRGVPVVANAFAEPAELFRPDETFQDASKPMSRAFASGLYRLLNDRAIRERLAEDGRKAAWELGGKGTYQAAIVKLYQQLLDTGVKAG